MRCFSQLLTSMGHIPPRVTVCSRSGDCHVSHRAGLPRKLGQHTTFCLHFWLTHHCRFDSNQGVARPAGAERRGALPANRPCRNAAASGTERDRLP